MHVLRALFLLLAHIILLFIDSVSAHGFLGKVTIDGTDYSGPSPQANPSAANSKSAIRQVADISPVKGASNVDLRCGLSAAAASQEANAKPGSDVQFWWVGGGGQEWPHNTGPLMTYMAACTGTSDCTTFDPANAAWFKIDQIGMRAQNSWYQADFMQGKSLSVTLPTGLSSGHYLLRSEIIALHNAVSEGGAEFYPACVQLNVAGGSGATKPDPTVSFPGAYSDTDPGIFVPEIYNSDLKYVFPGGPVSNLAAPADSSGSPPTSGNSNSSAPASSGAPSAAPTSPASSGLGTSSSGSVCRLAKRSDTLNARRKRSVPVIQSVRLSSKGLGHWARLKLRGWVSW